MIKQVFNSKMEADLDSIMVQLRKFVVVYNIKEDKTVGHLAMAYNHLDHVKRKHLPKKEKGFVYR